MLFSLFLATGITTVNVFFSANPWLQEVAFENEDELLESSAHQKFVIPNSASEALLVSFSGEGLPFNPVTQYHFEQAQDWVAHRALVAFSQGERCFENALILERNLDRLYPTHFFW